MLKLHAVHLALRHQISTAAEGVQRTFGMGLPLSFHFAGDYLPGECNQVADSPAPGEWSLHSDVVSMIWDLYDRAEVDLFTSE